MEHSGRPDHGLRLRDIFVWAALGLFFGGYPLAWILFSPKSVLRSTDEGFVHGFGAGVGMTLGMVLGVTLLGFAWSRFVRRFNWRVRRRLEIALMVGFLIVAFVAMSAFGLPANRAL